MFSPNALFISLSETSPETNAETKPTAITEKSAKTAVEEKQSTIAEPIISGTDIIKQNSVFVFFSTKAREKRQVLGKALS